MVRIVTLLAVLIIILSCNKDATTVSDDVLIITPELVISYHGKNWNTIESGLSNKKDYLYTTLNNSTTLAGISLAAKDPDAPVKNYRLIFNTDHQNIITKVVLTSTDTVNVVTGNQQMLYYYGRVFNPMPAVMYRWASDNNASVNVSDLLVRLNNANCMEPYLSFGNNQIRMSAEYSAGTRSFRFNL